MKSSIRAAIGALKPKPLKKPATVGVCVQCGRTISEDSSGHDARCNAQQDPQDPPDQS